MHLEQLGFLSSLGTKLRLFSFQSEFQVSEVYKKLKFYKKWCFRVWIVEFLWLQWIMFYNQVSG